MVEAGLVSVREESASPVRSGQVQSSSQMYSSAQMYSLQYTTGSAIALCSRSEMSAAG